MSEAEIVNFEKELRVMQNDEEGVSLIVKLYEEKTADQMFEELGYEKKKPSFLLSACVIVSYEKEFAKETKYICFMKTKDIRCNFGITMEELKAINKKCEELGWI